ncbi:MAG TPA: YDG domain-containing protein, partial [Flavobacterium sp.]|nr:YDG domain-containing protein [Flavobacterium sp.]
MKTILLPSDRKFPRGLFGLLFFLAVFGINSVNAQIYSNVFTGASTCPTPGNVPTIITNATGTAFTRQTATCTATADVLNSTTLNNTAVISDTNYLEFTVTANAGYRLGVASLSFLRQGSATAPNKLEVRYSTNNFSSSTAWGSAPLTTTSAGSAITWDMPDFTVAPGVTLKFRFYPYGTQRADLGAAAAASTGTFRLDNVTLNGTCVALPVITTTGTFPSLSTTYGTPSAATTFTVSASNISSNLDLQAPGYEISQTPGGATGYASSQTIIGSAGTVPTTTVYIRLAATTAPGTYSSDLQVLASPEPAALVAMGTSNVSTKALTITGATAQDKTYDRTTTATITGATATGTENGDAITVTGGGTFDDFNFGTGKNVTPALALSGAHSAYYTFTQPTGLTANISKKDLTIPDAAAQNKLFDGNTDAVITGTLTGVIAPDSVTLSGTGTFASSAVAEGIAVTSTSTISGDTSNYNLVQPTGLTANIFAAELLPQTIDFGPLSDVVYGSGSFGLTATATSGLTVSYSSSDTSVATVSGSTVTIVGVGTTTITASQAGNGTYDVAPIQTQPLTVTPKALTVDSALAVNKIYDGNNSAAVTGTLNGIINSDDVTFIGSGTFALIAVANGIAVTSASSLGGMDAANYTLTQPSGLSADITPKALTANSATVNNKVYDGNTSATLSNLALTGVITPDVISASGSGTFASADVANGIGVTASLSLSGADAANYTITQPTGLVANITALGLTITGISGVNKVYDRTTAATLSGTAVLNGVVGLDNVVVS